MSAHGPFTLGNAHGENVDMIYSPQGAVAQVFGIAMHAKFEDLIDERWAEPIAIGRLLAAAPQLLAACQAAFNHLLPRKDDDATWAVMSQLIAAVAKAKGETPCASQSSQPR